jgi:hypothetical protein
MDTQIKVTSITVELGGTINLGNFENVRVGLAATADVPDGMSIEAATAQLTAQVKSALQTQLRTVAANVGSSAMIAALEDIGAAEKTDSDDFAY